MDGYLRNLVSLGPSWKWTLRRAQIGVSGLCGAMLPFLVACKDRRNDGVRICKSVRDGKMIDVAMNG